MTEQMKILNGLKKDIQDEDSKFKKERNAYELKKLVKQTGHAENLIMFSADKAQLDLVT
jgi:hypothetical protein